MGRILDQTRIRPFETVVLLVAPICGALLVALDVRPPSVEQAMPDLVQTGWAAGLLVAGLTGLLGIFWPGRCATRLGIELAAVLILATVTGMYVVALSATAGRQAIPATSFIVAVALGSVWRSVEIVLVLRRLSRNGREVERESPLGRTR
ncbi:hypothetical protein [Micromonospora inyonensis]|uniref:Uncharacterized protein n=1 Tax=Micromonospora inyonensis TaxID=47866 RepID=A0A1C6RF17_9ACTN|nr:hypothetical protein [Micromonospora inyonensis]SCL15668.1 hypothetical protein GA0074694_1314 [Micromonospora inyonensis]